MSNDQTKAAIREIFMQHGFTIKEGQTDLKPYVYEAAEALIAKFAAPSTTGAEVALKPFLGPTIGEVLARKDATIADLRAQLASERQAKEYEQRHAVESEKALAEVQAQLARNGMGDRAAGYLTHDSFMKLALGGVAEILPVESGAEGKVSVYFRASPAPASAQPAEPKRRDIFAICDAYESGIGHGLQRDGYKSGDIFGNPAHGMAYEIGYEEGERRAASTATVTAPAQPAELMTYDEFMAEGKRRGFKLVGATVTEPAAPAETVAYWKERAERAEDLARQFARDGDNLCKKLDALAAPAAQQAAPAGWKHKDFIEQIVLGVAEIPDRDSPEDQPEMMLVTTEELRAIVEGAFETADENGGLEGSGAAPATAGMVEDAKDAQRYREIRQNAYFYGVGNPTPEQLDGDVDLGIERAAMAAQQAQASAAPQMVTCFACNGGGYRERHAGAGNYLCSQCEGSGQIPAGSAMGDEKGDAA